MRTVFILMIMVLQLLATTAFEKAYEIYKSGDFEKSLQIFIQLANDEKDYDAAYILGYMYEHGEGCKINENESKKWYKFSSHGYYWLAKPDPSRDIKKENRKLYATLNKFENRETQETIKQYTQSLYSIKAHATNYFLPISYRENSLYSPTNGHDAKAVEIEFQVSIKYDFGVNLLGFNEIYSAGYTQKSFWQAYSKSAYFRETNYNPEFFITIPTVNINKIELLKAVRLSFEHESNGRGGEEERSWNFIASSFYFQTGWLFSQS